MLLHSHGKVISCLTGAMFVSSSCAELEEVSAEPSKRLVKCKTMEE